MFIEFFMFSTFTLIVIRNNLALVMKTFPRNLSFCIIYYVSTLTLCVYQEDHIVKKKQKQRKQYIYIYSLR